MIDSLFEIIALVAFIAINTIAWTFFFIIRYHFNAFSVKGNIRAKRILWAMNMGLIIFLIISGFLTYLIFQQ